MSLTIVTYSVTLSPGSFVRDKPGYAVAGVINGVSREMIVKVGRTTASFSLLVEGKSGTLTSNTSPVPVTLDIGNDSGTAQMNAKFD